MVHLDALKCSKCGDQCDPALVETVETIPYVMCCKHCGKLYCGVCSQTGDCDPCECRVGNCVLYETKTISDLCSLINYAPADELQLIDLLPCLIFNCCSVCGESSSHLYRCGIQRIACPRCCKPPHAEMHLSTRKTEDRFHRIINELTEKFIQEPRSQSLGTRGNLPVKGYYHCNACCNMDEKTWGSLFTGMIWEEPHCYDCYSRVLLSHSAPKSCDCFRKFFAFIRCIPENQLHKLTYSKWVKAAGCERHQHILQDLFARSDDFKKGGKLHSFFKNEDVAGNSSETRKNTKPTITIKTTAIANDRQQNTSTLSNLDPSIPDKLLPDRITCSCGCEQELSNMFDCLTCSTYGVCSLCLANEHWGHEMNKSKKTVAFCLINLQSEATRQKLIEFIEQAKGLNQEGGQSFEKLCHVLGVVFKDAMLSEDLHRIQSLLTKANTSELEKYFKNAMNSTTKLYKFIDSFCEDLLEAVDEEKQSTTVSIQELSSSSNSRE